MSFILEGGFIFWLIVVLIAVAAVLFIDRLLRLRKVDTNPQDFLQGLFNVLERDSELPTEEVMDICEDTSGPLPALVTEALTHRDSNEAHLREILAATAHVELARLERRAMLLSLFAQILPLIGLIGTFVGGLAALGAIDTQAPLVQTGALTNALSGALSTTVAGLIGAAFCYTAHHILVLRIDAVCLNVDSCAAQLLDFFARRRAGHTADADKLTEVHP